MVDFPILSLDVGIKRVGIAYMQQPCAVADLKKILNRESNQALEQILFLLKEKNVKTLIAGMPINAKNQKTQQCEDVEKFCRRIERRFPLKTIFVDEYLSSVEAKELSGNKTVKIDDIAAEIILKRFLSANGLLSI